MSDVQEKAFLPGHFMLQSEKTTFWEWAAGFRKFPQKHWFPYSTAFKRVPKRWQIAAQLSWVLSATV